MAIADTVKQDLAAAMKAGEKDRVGALRLVLSELQKAAKDGGDDEQAVLRRERKRRLEAAAALSGHEDAILRALEGHVECDVYLRGNLVTLEGDAEAVDTAVTVVSELAELADQGHEIAPGTIHAVTGALDQHQSPAAI